MKMVFISQSNSNEETQSRQPIAKRFSKTVSSVQRARFHKPRPKVPSFKRSESNSAQISTIQSEIQKPGKEKGKQESEKAKEQTVDKSNEAGNDTVLKTENITFEKSSVHINSAELNSAESQENENVSPKDRCKIGFIVTSEGKKNLAKQSRSVFPITDNLFHVDISDALKSDTLVPCEATSSNVNGNLNDKYILQCTVFSDDVSAVPSLSPCENILAPETSEKASESKEKGSEKCDTRLLHKDCNSIENTFPTPLDKENLPQPVEKQNELNAVVSDSQDSLSARFSKTSNAVSPEILKRYLQSPQAKDVPSSNVPSTFADKISKYPHLTSILSKKRTEPKRDVTYKKRKKYRKGDAVPERSKMTIADLIYWNPAGSDLGNVKLESKAASEINNIPSNSADEKTEDVLDDEPQNEEDICASVPKLIISEDGEINIDQVSLVVSRKKLPRPTISIEEKSGETTYSSYRKRPMTKQWTAKDTTIFYKALSLVGTDFGLMEKLIPHRTRRELKLKFKREEKFNIELVNRAMYESMLTFDANTLEEHIENLNSLCEDMESECMQENKQPSTRGRRSSKKCKMPTGRKENYDKPDLQLSYIEESIKVCAANNKRKGRKLEKQSEIEELPVSQTMDELVVNFKRRRKTKKLPEDFIYIDDLDDKDYIDITESVSQSSEVGSTKMSVKPKSPAEDSVPSHNTNNISSSQSNSLEVVQINESDNVPIIPTLTVPASETSFNVSCIANHVNDGNDNYFGSKCEQECITVDIMCDNDALNTANPLSNVMANEVVTSQEPEVKSKRKTRTSSEQLKSKPVKGLFDAFHPSSTNYTPTDDLLPDKQGKQTPFEFTPKSSKRTYSKSKMLTPESYMMITSLQTPFLTPDRSNAQTLLTTLNMCESQPIAIPITPEGESATNSVMILAPSPGRENTIHLYLYNNPAE